MKKKQLLRINFLNKCKIHKVFPNFITHNIKTSIHNKQSFKALQVCKLRWLNEEIKHAFWSRDHICLKIWILHKDLCSSLHPAIWDSIDYNNRSFIEQFSYKAQSNYNKKLNNLIQVEKSYSKDKFSNITPSFEFYDRLVNLSDFSSFSKDEIDFLNYGLKFTPPISTQQKNSY